MFLPIGRAGAGEEDPIHNAAVDAAGMPRDASVRGTCFDEAETLTVGPSPGCVRATLEGTGVVVPVSRPSGTPIRIRRAGGAEPSVRFRAVSCPPRGSDFALWTVGSTFSECDNAMSWRGRCEADADRTFTWRWMAEHDDATELQMAGVGIRWEIEVCVP